MKSAFGRRLLLVTALEIAAVLGLAILVVALLAFGNYIGAVRGELHTTMERVVDALKTSDARHDARVAGTLAAMRYPRSSVVVLFVDAEHRVAVYADANPPGRPIVDVRPRSDTPHDSRTSGMFERLVMGLATAFGLQSIREHVGGIDIIVRPNDAVLARTAWSYVPEFGIALALALTIAFVMARILTRQVLRPLVDVIGALERFAAGDLTPQPIAADHRHQLGALALAYNGAIAQMERAFGERDRANAAMRQFVADAGHQLRTPLTVVRGFIAILRKGELRSPHDRERILDTMNRQSQIMSSLIDKLMLLERWEDEPAAAPSEAIDIARLALDVIGPIAESEPLQRLRLTLPDVGLAAIDPIDLTHALTNIIDNALKYTRGSVDVGTRREHDRVFIDVVDSGPGMTSDEARHAFDRFFRGTRRDVEGSGLGLSIARRAIERAGGTLSLETRSGAGCRFTIALPSSEIAKRPASVLG